MELLGLVKLLLTYWIFLVLIEKNSKIWLFL